MQKKLQTKYVQSTGLAHLERVPLAKVPSNDHKLFTLPVHLGRWGFIALGIVAQLCLGTVYAWSIFRKPIELALTSGGATVSATDTLLPFAALLFTFSITMPIVGRRIERYGANNVTMVGAICVGLGYYLSGSATSIPQLIITYGVIAGVGVGIVYGVPLAVAAKWFPDYKGLAVGLTVIGFGLSPLITAPLASQAIEKFGVSDSFRLFGVAFAVILMLVATQLRFPMAPVPPLATASQSSAPQSIPSLPFERTRDVLTSPTFIGLWSCYAIGTTAGLMAIGIAGNVGKDTVGLDTNIAIGAISIFAIFNAAGRPIFGWLTQKLGVGSVALVSFWLIFMASITAIKTGPGEVFKYFLTFGVLWFALGGWLAIAPTATLLAFGERHYSRNYGFVFTAFGVGALLGTWLAGHCMDVFGSYRNAFLGTAVLSIIGGCIANVMLRQATSDPW